MSDPDIDQIIAGMSEAQKRALSHPHALVIDNYVAMPLSIGPWPSGIFCYEYPEQGLLSPLGLRVREALRERG